MDYIDFTRKALAITVTNNGGFSSYGSSARNGHLYYSNNVSDPWGNDKLRIGSFDLKTAGTYTFVLGNENDLVGTALAGKSNYMSYANLYSAGISTNHFITAVIDRDKTPEIGVDSCPPNHDFGNGYNHNGITIDVKPYYFSGPTTLTAGSSLTTSYWNSPDLGAVPACYNLTAFTPSKALEPETGNFYTSQTWTNGNQLIPYHGCSVDGPGTAFDRGVSWKFYTVGTPNPDGCAVACVYSTGYGNTYNGHFWGTRNWTNPAGTQWAKISTTNGRYGPILSQEYGLFSGPVGTKFTLLFLRGATDGSPGNYQCQTTTGFYSNGVGAGPQGATYFGFPRYHLDVQARCNAGSRTSSQEPYYSAGGSGVFAGYGFYTKFTFDPLCYPCA
jgi:hypothetical protein